MTISITHNDDGSITAECNGEEVTFVPKTRAAPIHTDPTPNVAGPLNPPILPGRRHRAFLYVPVGNEPGVFEPGGFAPTVRFIGNQAQLERDLIETIVTNQIGGLPTVRIVTAARAKFDVQRVLDAADRATENASISLYLTSGK